MEAKDHPKRGRPSDYSAEIGMTICCRLIDGESLRAICADSSMPDKATVLRWIGRHTEFRDQYVHAREFQADCLVEDALEIADSMDNDNIAVVRHRIRIRQWVAARMAPRKYGN